MAIKGASSRPVPSHLPLAAVAGQATFHGGIALIDLPHAIVRAMLPGELAVPGQEPAQCPCLLVFGEQSESTAFVAGLPVPWGVRYLELMVAVPCVRRDDASGDRLFVRGMACDAWWAAWNGNLHYGFSKRLAPLSWDGERFSAGGENERYGFQATIRPRAGTNRDTLARIREAAALPVLGRTGDGRFVDCRFDWYFGHATVVPAVLRLAVGTQFPELPWSQAGACPGEACRVRGMRWRLSWPGLAAR